MYLWNQTHEGEGLPHSCLRPLQEGMLKDLQKSVEEEERVWKAKVGAAEEELQKVWLAYMLPELAATAWVGPRAGWTQESSPRFSRVMGLLLL